MHGDKEAALQRFRKHYKELSDGVKARSVEFCSLDEWFGELKLPRHPQTRTRERRVFVQRRRPLARLRRPQYPARLWCVLLTSLPPTSRLNQDAPPDYHHHSNYPTTETIEELMPRILALWETKGIRPKFHLSEPRKGAVTPMVGYNALA